MRKLLTLSLISAAIFGAMPALANTGTAKLMSAEGSYEGMFGRFDRAQLQRGFQIYKEVCASCHSMNELHFRNLGEKYGPFYSPEHANPNENPVVKAIAKGYVIADVDASGNDVERPGLPSDRFPAPFASDAQAKAANGGVAPPDLSVITKARMGGADYIYSLMMGYGHAVPHGVTVGAGKSYNPYFAGGVIGMAQQLTDDRVTYADTEANKGIKPTAAQESRDIAAFLQWASDPHQTERKAAGLGVMLFLFVFALFTWFSYQSIWRKVEH